MKRKSSTLQRTSYVMSQANEKPRTLSLYYKQRIISLNIEKLFGIEMKRDLQLNRKLGKGHKQMIYRNRNTNDILIVLNKISQPYS